MTTTGIVIAVFVVIAQIVGAILKQRAERAEAERRQQAQRGGSAGVTPVPSTVGSPRMADDGTGATIPSARREVPRPPTQRPQRPPAPLAPPATAAPTGSMSPGGPMSQTGRPDAGSAGQRSAPADGRVHRRTSGSEGGPSVGQRGQPMSTPPPAPPARQRSVLGSGGSSGAQPGGAERSAAHEKENKRSTQRQAGPGGGRLEAGRSPSDSSGAAPAKPAAVSAFEGAHYELERSPILTPVASIESGAAAAMARPTGRAGAAMGRSGEALALSARGMALGTSLRSPQALRDAFLLTEILGRPASDRFGAGGVVRSEP